MMEKAKACELFDTSGKNVNHFKVTSYGGHDIEGWICKSRGTKMGSLIIETVDGKETLQYVQGMPKIKYYDSRDEIGTPTIFEKYDGCFHASQRIRLWDGSVKTIKEIVDGNLEVMVPSLNEESGIVEPKKVINWAKSKFDGYFLRIDIENSPMLICTPDHPIYVSKDKKVNAESLEEGDIVKSISFGLSDDVKSMVYGTLLGDSWLFKNKIKTLGSSHSIKQKEYLDYKSSFFRHMNVSERTLTSGYGSEIFSFRVGFKDIKSVYPIFNEIYDDCYVENMKKVNPNWTKKLNPIALAFWYMDDGSLAKHENENYNSYTVHLHTEGFTLEENELLVTTLKDKFGVNAKLLSNGKGHLFINISQNNSNKFLELVAPHIHESMQYKLPIELRNIPKIELKKSENYEIIDSKVISIEEIKNSGSKYARKPVRYAITVEDNHNYVAGNCFVGNTNIVAFPLIVDGDVEEVMFKTRGLPQADKEFYNKTIQVWSDGYSKAVIDEKLSFAFELYGSNNSHEVNYREHGIDLDLALLSILDKGKGLPVGTMFDIAKHYNINTAFQHFWIDYEDGEYGVTPSMAFNEWYGSYFDMNKIDDVYFPNIYELYKSLESIYERINMAYQKDHPGIIIEGSVWHYGDTENHLIKNKALSVREGHIKQACGIPHHDIRKAIIKTDESYDGELREATTAYIINNVNDELLEEYESSMVYDKKTEDKIKAVLGKYLRKVEVTEELSSIVSQLREECGADADPSDMMRYYSQLPIYNKNLVGKVYQTIVSMS